MKKIALALLAGVVCSLARAADVPAHMALHKAQLSEWFNTDPAPTNRSGRPVVLLVGDSITWQYHDLVAAQLAATAVCETLATTACVADPVYRPQLETVLTGKRFAVIHFNNGLRDFEYSNDDYRAGYEQMLKLIRKEQPDAKLILALSTPIKPTQAKKEEIAIVDARNDITKRLAAQFGATIDDLHALSKDHPEYYKDKFDFLPAGKQLQAEQVAKTIVNALKNGESGVGGVVKAADVPAHSAPHKDQFMEWCIAAPAPTDLNGESVVLLVGDSITWQYHELVATQLAATAACETLATSACVAEPVFRAQLERVLAGKRFAVIHFNNGLHDFDYSTDEYRAGYEQMLNLIRKEQPDAKLILALSTPIKPAKASNKDNGIVDARNEAVKQLAVQFNAPIDDLYAISKGHPEYYKDAYHYLPEAKQLQAEQVAKMIANALKNDAPGVDGGGKPVPRR